MPSEKRKAKRQQYFNAVKKSKKYERGLVLKEGMSGFLITCNNREREAVREGYNILNEYADRLYGLEKPKNEEGNEADDTDEVDIDAALDKEKAALQAAREQKPSERRFQQVESGANNCIFIKTTVESPTRLVDEVIRDLQESKVQKCRFILRLLPILGTCKAYEKNIEELAEKILPDSIEGTKNSTYCVLFKTRNTNQVAREDVFKILAGVMKNTSDHWRVDLEAPDICIVVEIIRTVCCIGVVNNFYARKKYNLVEIVKRNVDELEKSVKSDSNITPETGSSASNKEDSIDVVEEK